MPSSDHVYAALLERWAHRTGRLYGGGWQHSVSTVPASSSTWVFNMLHDRLEERGVKIEYENGLPLSEWACSTKPARVWSVAPKVALSVAFALSLGDEACALRILVACELEDLPTLDATPSSPLNDAGLRGLRQRYLDAAQETGVSSGAAFTMRLAANWLRAELDGTSPSRATLPRDGASDAAFDAAAKEVSPEPSVPRRLVVRARELLKEAGLTGASSVVNSILVDADQLTDTPPTVEGDGA